MTEAHPPQDSLAADTGEIIESEADLLAMIVLEDQHGPLRLPVVAVLQCLHILVEKGLAPPIPTEWFDRTLPAQWRVTARTLPSMETAHAY